MPPERRATRTSTSVKIAREAARPYPKRTDSHNSSGHTQPLASVTGHGSGKLRLTVKAQPSRLRQATSGSSVPSGSYAEASESDATPVPPTRTARSTRNPRTVVEPDSDDLEEDDEVEEEEEAEEEEEEEEDEDAEGEIDDTTMVREDSEDVDEDEEMEDMSEHPPPPIIKQARVNGKPNVTVTAPLEGPLKSVEAKEMEDEDDDDDELSELESEGEGNENENDEDDDEGDSDDENGSRSATPDLSKLTRRQRGFYEETDNPNLMALSNEAQKKKHLTVEEHAMRRQEMAKRRKNLSEKRNEEEKMETINKLLSKPAPKRRTRAEILAQERADGQTPSAEDGDVERPDPLCVRWVNSRAGSRIGVPEEWLEKPVGEVFQAQIMALRAGGMVQEVS